MPRYNTVAIALHWLIALLVIAQIYVGWTFGDMERGPARTEWFTWHKTLGVLILLLSLVRLGWRLTNPPPPLPAETPAWEKRASQVVHVGFYVVLIALPLTGWAAISGGRDGTTDLLFGIPFPLLPGLSDGAGDALGGAHELLVKITYALLALHVAAALKHQFLDKSPIAGRMPPFGVK